MVGSDKDEKQGSGGSSSEMGDEDHDDEAEWEIWRDHDGRKKASEG